MQANLSSLTARTGGLDLCAIKAPCDGGGGGRVGGFGLHPFCFMVRLFDPIFLLSWSHLLACGLGCPVTHLSSPQDFAK